MGVGFICREHKESSLDLCGQMGLESYSGAVCPEAGDYYFDASVKIPEWKLNFGGGE